MWRLIRLDGLSVIVCLSTTGWVQAATAQNTPGITDLIRDRQDRLLEQQQRRIDELKDLPGSPLRQQHRPPPSTPAASRSEPSSWAAPMR
ncbi:Channel-forming transporter/cytolysins activator of TpsB family [Pseudomonas sp. R4-35-07]|nr:Channel-forming transporter/cytolysins activator of TpsB family [Pseudomonas sp. R4-35-07]